MGCGISGATGHERALVIEDLPHTRVALPQRHPAGESAALLENTDLTIERIAHDTGFGTATSLRNQLAAELGVSPSAYRATFRVGS